MNQVLLYTFPQWIIFAAIFGAIYGWVEDKKVFRLIGLGAFVMLGLFSLYVILGEYLAAGQYLTPEEVLHEKLYDEIIDEPPIEAYLLPAYISFLVAAVLALAALVLDWLNKKYYRLFTVLASLVSLIGFFIVVGAVRTL